MVVNKTSLKEKSDLEKCWESLVIFLNICLYMEHAAKKWGDTR